MSYLPHLLELRRRCLLVLACFGGIFLVLFFSSGALFQTVVSPLLHQLPKTSELIATQITSSVLTPLKLASDLALLLSAPIALFHLWRFIGPGLYKNEQSPIKAAIIMSILLFILGMLFCFYIVLPFMFQFFIHALPKEVHFMPDMTYALDFITRMLFLFGLCFQVPLICIVLVKLQITTRDNLKNIRPYIIVGAFTLGMLLTPPDVFSQIMLAVPLCLLYELGLLLVMYLP